MTNKTLKAVRDAVIMTDYALSRRSNFNKNDYTNIGVVHKAQLKTIQSCLEIVEAMLDRQQRQINEIPDEYWISDEQINKAWGNANFGENTNKRKIILNTLLQTSGVFSTGHTAMCICQDLGLLGVGTSRNLPKLTKKGKRVMYYWNKYLPQDNPAYKKLEELKGQYDG